MDSDKVLLERFEEEKTKFEKTRNTSKFWNFIINFQRDFLCKSVSFKFATLFFYYYYLMMPQSVGIYYLEQHMYIAFQRYWCS